MTIAIAGHFTEGVVFAADSAVSYSEGGAISQVYEGAQKIYHIGLKADCSDSPYGAMVCGTASFAGQSWRNVFASFYRASGGANLDEATKTAKSLVQFLEKQQPDLDKRDQAGVFLAGFGTNDSAVRCFRIDAKHLAITPVPPMSVQFDGIPHVVQRLLFGIDDQTIQNVKQAFAGITVDVQDGAGTKSLPLADVVLQVIQRVSLKCEPDVDMPLRDAIDYVHFLTYSTIKYFKFGHGAKVCGGEIELAAITLDRGFRRIRRKPLDVCLPVAGYAERRGTYTHE